MSWLYCSDTGKLFLPTGRLYLTGYAGHGEGLNNPKKQNVHDIGPLPENLYQMVAFVEDDSHTGLATIILKAVGSQPMFGRDEFRIHGDNGKVDQSASHGCIVIGHMYNRKAIWDSEDHFLYVSASGHDAIP